MSQSHHVLGSDNSALVSNPQASRAYLKFLLLVYIKKLYYYY